MHVDRREMELRRMVAKGLRFTLMILGNEMGLILSRRNWRRSMSRGYAIGDRGVRARLSLHGNCGVDNRSGVNEIGGHAHGEIVLPAKSWLYLGLRRQNAF